MTTASLIRNAALYLVAFWIAILHPYDFAWPDGSLVELIQVVPEFRLVGLLKTAAHVILFLPLGFLLGRAVDSAGYRRAWLGIASITLLAVGSELVQLFVVNRTASVQDILADFVGVAAGFWLARLESVPGSRLAAGVTDRWRYCIASIPILCIGLVLIPLQDADFFGWNPGYPLLLGNEDTMDRPWKGEVYEFALFDRALSPETARRLSDSASPSASGMSSNPLIHPEFENDDLEFRDSALVAVLATASELPDLRLDVVGPGLIRALPEGGIDIATGGALRSHVAPARLYEAIGRAGAVTTLVEFKALDPDAGGPARILSMSLTPITRNLTIGQESDRLVYRFRNRISGDNGTGFEIDSARCLTLGKRQRVVAVSTFRSTRLYTNGRECGSATYTLVPYVARLFASLEVRSAKDLLSLVFMGWFLVYVYELVTLQWRRPWRSYREAAAALLSAVAMAILFSLDLGMA